MGSITGMFDGAKKNVRNGKDSIRQSVSGSSGQEMATGDELRDNTRAAYGKSWSSDYNTSNFDLPGSSSIPNDITPQNQHHNAGISWDFSKLGTEPDFKGSGISGMLDGTESISDFGGGDDGDLSTNH